MPGGGHDGGVRPAQGYRGSYKEFEEQGIAPQVVFEIISPRSRANDLIRKFRFYDRFGVEEYYVYDPDKNELFGWRREDDGLQEIPSMNGWTSPRLKIRFELENDELLIHRPDGKRFLTFVELQKLQSQTEQEKATAERKLQEQAEELTRLRDRLRQMGETA